MKTKKTYTPMKFELEWFEEDVMTASQQVLNYDPFSDDIYM